MEPMARAFLLGLERSNMFIELFSRDLDGGDWLQMPPGIPNPPIWIVGHLAFQRAQMLELLTGERTYDESWVQMFRMGCEGVDPSHYPDIATCREFLADRLADLKSYLEGVTLEELESPPLTTSKFFDTKADVLVHLTHHEAHHTGCLSLTRRVLGKGKLI